MLWGLLRISHFRWLFPSNNSSVSELGLVNCSKTELLLNPRLQSSIINLCQRGSCFKNWILLLCLYCFTIALLPSGRITKCDFPFKPTSCLGNNFQGNQHNRLMTSIRHKKLKRTHCVLALSSTAVTLLPTDNANIFHTCCNPASYLLNKVHKNYLFQKYPIVL